MSDKLRNAYERIGGLMNLIADVFHPGVKVTVLVRRPGKPGEDFMMSDDDPSEAMALIKRRVASGPTIAGPTQ